MEKDLRFELFEIKQKFLREIPHPKLILKQLKYLEIKGGIQERKSLGFETVNLEEEIDSEGLSIFLDKQIKITLQNKQLISIAATYQSLVDELEKLYINQLLLLKKMQSYLPKDTEYPDADIKMSVPFDRYLILKTIRELNLQESEIKDYLCKEIKANTQSFNVLVESCLRANKIICHA